MNDASPQEIPVVCTNFHYSPGEYENDDIAAGGDAEVEHKSLNFSNYPPALYCLE